MTYYVPAGNWTNNVINSLGSAENETLLYPISVDPMGDPAPNCPKDFTASYSCGLNTNLKKILVAREANGQDATFDCSAEGTQCNNLKLTLTDEGKLTLTSLDGAKVIWDSVSNGSNPLMQTILPANHQFQIPDDNNKPLTIPAYAGDGKVNEAVDVGEGGGPGRRYPNNYLLPGQMLELGQWIGSPSGTCRLIMGTPEAPNSLQVVMNILGCNTLDATSTSLAGVAGTGVGAGAVKVTPDTNSARLYTIPPIHNENIGKVGYVNNKGQLQMYPDTKMTTYGEQFEQIAPETPANSGYNITGAFLGAPFQTDTVETCQARCTTGGRDAAKDKDNVMEYDTQACAGVIFDTRTTTTENCQLLDKTMYGQKRIIDNNYQYYIRQKGVMGQDNSCPSDVNIQNAGFWNSLDKVADMTGSTKCGLAKYVETERGKVASELPTVYNNLQNRDRTGFKFWYEQLQYKYALLKDKIFNTHTAIDANFKELKETKQNLADWSGEQLQNLEAMNEDRDLNMMSQNYRHILWSILAIIIILGTIKFTKSVGSGPSSSISKISSKISSAISTGTTQA
jgi:hypothetical protein